MVLMVRQTEPKMTLNESLLPARHRFKPSLGLGLEENLLISDKVVSRETIHSGHFMVSELDDPEVQEEDGTPSLANESDESDREVQMSPHRQEEELGKFCLTEALQPVHCSQPKASHEGPQGRPLSSNVTAHSQVIDSSLTKLLECMTLVYSGELTSPRWKTFKGVKMKLKEKIRLNNIIWRAWHLQFVAKRKPMVCQFASPLEIETHTKPEAVILEGKYLKRGTKTVLAEYKKCRLFYRDRARCIRNQNQDNMAMDLDARWPSWSNSSLHSPLEDEFFMDFSDTLFGSLIPNEPFDFPNPREIARAGIADFIQPGLVQLQPALDDFMDTFEPLQDFLLARHLPPLPEESLLSESSLRNQPSRHQSHMGNPSSVGPFRSGNIPGFENAFEPPLESSTSLLEAKRKGKSQLLKPASFIQGNRFESSSYEMVVSPPTNSFTNMLVQSNLDKRAVDTKPHLEQKENPAKAHKDSPSSHQTATASVFALKPIKSKPPSPPNPGSTVRRKTFPQGLPMKSIYAKLPSLLKVNSNLSLNKPHTTEQLPSDNSLLLMNSEQIQPSATIPQPNHGIEVQSPEKKHVPSVASFVLQRADSVPSFKFSIPSEPSPSSILKPKRSQTSKNDMPGYRRHSYTPISCKSTQLVIEEGGAINSINQSAESVEGLARVQRVRSRSISSPQGVRHISAKLPQASSLTNISSTFSQPILPALSPSTTANISSQNPKAYKNSGVVSSSQAIAQLLTSGVTFHKTEGVTTSSSSNVINSPTMTIISSVPSPSTSLSQTLVLSPFTLTTVPRMTDMQPSLLLGSSGTVFSRSAFESQNILPIQQTTILHTTEGTNTCTPVKKTCTEPVSLSPSKTIRPKSDEERVQYKEHKRVCHINAEQKRRCNIKYGFESLHQLVPSLYHNPSAKVSKATMLQKAVDFIRTLKCERSQQLEEAESLRKQISQLNETINSYQNQLPATGAPILSQRTNHMRERFDEYVRASSIHNWKFWIFSLLLQPLLETFSSTVSTTSIDELCKTTLTWLNQHCTLASLRPVVLNSLRQLSTSTNILTDPSRLPEEATSMVNRKGKKGR